MNITLLLLHKVDTIIKSSSSIHMRASSSFMIDNTNESIKCFWRIYVIPYDKIKQSMNNLRTKLNTFLGSKRVFISVFTKERMEFSLGTIFG